MIEIQSKSQGAELTSIKVDNIERLHDGIKDWNRHAPVLFPIVGQVKNGETIVEGNLYRMGQHGFARDMEFEKIAPHSYRLTYNEETLEKYPYKFELNITYKDFAFFENDRLTSGKLKNAEDYWLSQFEGEIPILNMPTQSPRPAVQSFEGKRIYS